MNWIKAIIIILLFYFFAILQNSFFIHFNLLGATPNLVFALFFLFVFFEEKKINYTIIFYSAAAGLFLDIFSYTYLGVSLVLLIVIGLLVKIIQSLLKEEDDEHPFVYFLSLFSAGLIVYELLVMLYLWIFDPSHIAIIIDWRFFADIIYNTILASIFFWVYKKVKK